MVPKLFVPDRRIVVPKPPSYLKLDMAFAIGAGTKLMDKSRYRSHGTISGASWADGAHGRCLDFVAATPSYVEIPAAYTQLNFTSEDFSIIARFKVDDLTDHKTLLTRNNGVVAGYEWIINSAGRLVFYTFQALAIQNTDTTNGDIIVGTWYTVGISRNGASVKIYQDGVDTTTTSGVHIDPVTCALGTYIGYDFSRSILPFDGKIEFLRIIGGIALPASAHLAWHNALA